MGDDLETQHKRKSKVLKFANALNQNWKPRHIYFGMNNIYLCVGLYLFNVLTIYKYGLLLF